MITIEELDKVGLSNVECLLYHPAGVLQLSGVLANTQCEKYISSFNTATRPPMELNSDSGHYTKGTQYLEKNTYFEEHADEHTLIHFKTKVVMLSKMYAQITGFTPVAEISKFTDLIMKKYRNNGVDGFQVHFDNAAYTASRALAMIFYLNSVEEGGETLFPALNLAVKPTQGSVLIFPPYWNFPHQALPPVSGDKYTLNIFGFNA